MVEANLGMEVTLGVDSVLSSWTHAVSIDISEGFSTTTSVAVVEVLALWSITLVRCCVPGEHVGFHDVHFWAPHTTDIVGITVVVSTLGWVWRSVGIVAWHLDEVKGNVASTTSLGKVDVVLDGSSEEIWSIVNVWSVSSVSILVTKVPSGLWEVGCRSIDRYVSTSNDVLLDWLAVFGDVDLLIG